MLQALQCCKRCNAARKDMLMRGAELRAALHAGRRVYGIALEGYGSPRWPRFFANRGLDYIWLENEHTPLNRETFAWAAATYDSLNIAPLLRIPEPTAALAAQGVDAGAHGIIAPYVETMTQVKAIVGAVKYRPLKGEALRRALDEGVFPNPETRAYLDGFNPDAVVVIMIESPAGVAALPDLLRVPGVDAVLIGPHDLTVSHGIPEQYDHPVFAAACQRIIQVCHEHRVGVGLHYFLRDLEKAVTWANWGFNFMSHRGDTLYIADGAEVELATLRGRLAPTVPGFGG
jgi:4-hydroxy-2-oxoheptanedioate aldolase